MELRDIRDLQASFDARHASDVPWDTSVSETNVRFLEHLVVCLVGEVGEFANLVKKIVRGDVSYPEVVPRLSEEITDAFIYLIKICNQMGVDLECTYLERLAVNEERFKKFRR
ncbi:MAG: nucleotide pyrophosphohydrolase [Candidatus Binatia bacterium]